MKLNRLETHDRLLHFKKDQEANVFQGAEDCLKRNPLSLALQDKCHYVYMFAHPRTDDDGVSKRLIWQPRLTKPEAQTNSMLFKGYPGSDKVKIIWMIPDESMWPQYKKGNVTESSIVSESIYKFCTNKKELEAPEDDDFTDEQINAIYLEISRAARPVSLVASSEQES